MSTILDSVEQQLDPNTIEQISQQLGTDANTTRQAISTALPLLVGALAQKASDPVGEREVDQLVQSAPSDAQTPASALGFLGGSGNAALGGILGQILGGGAVGGAAAGAGSTPVEAGISKATGLDRAKVGRLIMMLAPIIIAQLAKRRQSGQKPGDVLQHERAQIEQRQPGLGGILGKMLDKNNDGSIIDDIARMAGGGGLGGMFGGRK